MKKRAVKFSSFIYKNILSYLQGWCRRIKGVTIKETCLRGLEALWPPTEINIAIEINFCLSITNVYDKAFDQN